MNYYRIYQQLIEFRKTHTPKGYTESHHILPRSMGGSDEKDNLVRLTGREHWIAHLLLWRIHGNKQCLHACHMMAMRCEERGIPQIRNSRIYETIRIHHTKHMMSFIGKKNSQFGTQWICNPTLKLNRKLDKNSEIPSGWVRGRNQWPKEKPPSRIKRTKWLKITDGTHNRTLCFEDQMIPPGWYPGLTLTPAHRKKIADARIQHNLNLRGTSGQGGRKMRQ